MLSSSYLCSSNSSQTGWEWWNKKAMGSTSLEVTPSHHTTKTYFPSWYVNTSRVVVWIIFNYFFTAHTTFYGALVKHIKSLLKEREQIPIFKEWVLNEALSTEKLQNGGTFQNVLTRRFDEVVIPLFADILLFVDHYSNLNLLKEEAR